MKIIEPSFSSIGTDIFENLDVDNNIEIYANEIVQVFLNILKNSHDNFVEKNISDSKIYIKSKNISSGVVVEISDNGGGIEHNIIDKIFDTYFSTKKGKNGTGLGLYMSKMIIEEHHYGRLYVENKDDGVCFSIELNKSLNKD